MDRLFAKRVLEMINDEAILILAHRAWSILN